MLMKVLFGSLALVASTATVALAEYPDRPITMVIPYGAGGATDISARSIVAPLSNAVGETLVVSNVDGAGGVTGSVKAMNAKNDGYTMLFARVGTHSVNMVMNATLPYTLDDFQFVGVYEINPVVCAVTPASGITNMDELVAKVNEGGVSYSSSGVGTLLNLAAVMVLKEFGVENPLESVVHIPVQGGGGAAATAVLNGTATFVCTNSSPLSNFVANGQLVPLLITTADPIHGFDAPSAAELGRPGLELLVGWTGIAGPAGLPDDVIVKWEEWMATATADERFRNTMTGLGSIIQLMGPAEANEFIDKQNTKFRALVDELGMRIEG